VVGWHAIQWLERQRLRLRAELCGHAECRHDGERVLQWSWRRRRHVWRRILGVVKLFQFLELIYLFVK
jgi:hypothetical protein